MITEKFFIRLLGLLLPVLAFTACDDKKEDDKPRSIALTVDKDAIKSNGMDAATFTVNADGQPLASGYLITGEDGASLAGNTFTTTIPATYTFHAVYEGLQSQTATVRAEQVVLTLTADVTAINDDGESAVTFTVAADADLPGRASIFYRSGETETLLEGNVFRSEIEGDYEFYCKYADVISNRITVTVTAVVLTLDANATSIKADGDDKVLFVIKANEADVSPEASLYRIDGENSVRVDNNRFTTITEGVYEFYALYRNRRSNAVTVEALESRLVLSTANTTVQTGETLTFTLVSDDVTDLTQSAQLHITKDDAEQIIDGNTFTPALFGVYTVYATCNGRQSNELTITVTPLTLTLALNKDRLQSTGKDSTTFYVHADGIPVDGKIFLEGSSQELPSPYFYTNRSGLYSFTAQYAGLTSSAVEILVYKTQFNKTSLIIGYVWSFCGYSPHLMADMNRVCAVPENNILFMSAYKSASYLASSDIDAEEYVNYLNYDVYPSWSIDLDWRESNSHGNNENNIKRSISRMRPATSGVAIESILEDNMLTVNLGVKVNVTGEYSLGAIIVEDNIMMRQRVYPTGVNTDGAYEDAEFIHNSVATFIMPGTNIHTGIPLGTLEDGCDDVTHTFTIDLTKRISNTNPRRPDVKPTNCRIIAYVMKKDGDKYCINNVASCPVAGSADYNYRIGY